MIKYLTIVTWMLLNVASCKKEKHNEVVRSFCFWKTGLSLDGKSDTLASDLKLKHFYVRYFDVDWNPYVKQAQPIASVRYIDFGKTNTQFTPSIFITNDVVLKSTKPQLDTLVNRLYKKINQISEKYFEQSATSYANKIAYADYEKQKGDEKKMMDIAPIVARRKLELQKNIHDILIDCDWSEKSKDNYFYLLEKIKSKFPNYKIEATIRLWQYKYFEKSGIPPVESGLLMCYNMTNPEDRKTENSIGTSNELEQYVTHDKYPLKLNIALPLYSWSLVFRGNQFKGILSNEMDFTKDSINFKKTDDNKFVLQDDIRVGDIYLRNGDEIRIEKIADSELQAMIETLTDKIKIDNTTRVTFFSFDNKYINDYGTQNISNYFSQF
jgi:hypothetical protein